MYSAGLTCLYHLGESRGGMLEKEADACPLKQKEAHAGHIEIHQSWSRNKEHDLFWLSRSPSSASWKSWETVDFKRSERRRRELPCLRSTFSAAVCSHPKFSPKSSVFYHRKPASSSHVVKLILFLPNSSNQVCTLMLSSTIRRSTLKMSTISFSGLLSFQHCFPTTLES